MEHTPRVALLIDAENASAKAIDVVLAEVARHGATNVRRAYANWKSPALLPWEKRLHEMAIQPVHQLAYSTGKNATDMALVIDAMDLLYAGSVDTFALMTSDGDFTPLVTRLRGAGKTVLGYGETNKAPQPFVQACSRFVHVDRAQKPTAPAAPHVPPAWSAQRLQADKRLVDRLQSAVAASLDEAGWAHLSTVAGHLTSKAQFDPRTYGFKKLVEVFEATELFDIRRNNLTVIVRPRR